jgi:hypothetical protein
VAHLGWHHSVKRARALGMVRLRIEADPTAERLCRATGATTVAELPSQSVAGRGLPLMTGLFGIAREVRSQVDRSVAVETRPQGRSCRSLSLLGGLRIESGRRYTLG